MWKLSLILIIALACSEKTKVSEVMVNVIEEIPKSNSIPMDTSYLKYGEQMLLGHFDPAKHEDYVLIDAQYADREGMYIHRDTYSAFLKMHNAAQTEGVNLVIRSATRNFDYQKGIWERKWNGETKVNGEDLSITMKDFKERALKILEYSSMPGTSRHHWGSDIDLNSFDNKWFEKGEGRKLWDWLETNAGDYGFCRPYTEKGELRPNGYQEERWHWSYMPLSSYFMSLAEEVHSDSKIRGFDGAEVADEIDVVEKYVFGVNQDCRD